MRYSQKLRRRMNSGATRMFKKDAKKTDFHVYSTKNHIGVGELADMFFCSIEKIKRAARKGILKDVGIDGNRTWFFDREEAIGILKSYVGEDGQLNLFNRKEKKSLQASNTVKK